MHQQTFKILMSFCISEQSVSEGIPTVYNSGKFVHPMLISPLLVRDFLKVKNYIISHLPNKKHVEIFRAMTSTSSRSICLSTQVFWAHYGCTCVSACDLVYASLTEGLLTPNIYNCFAYMKLSLTFLNGFKSLFHVKKIKFQYY